MSNLLQSLRKSIWSGDKVRPEDVGEALRDIANAFKKLNTFEPIEMLDQKWAEPFVLGIDHAPSVVLLGSARLAKQPYTVAAGPHVAGAWNGSQFTVNHIANLVVGTSYDLVFLVFG